jgi:predicted RNA-binding protein with PUA-like domain
MQHWLLKTEPSTSGIDDLQAAPRKTSSWEGVRNYQARNFIRDRIKKGDEALPYHSSCDVPGVVAIVRLKCRFKRVITLVELQAHARDQLASMMILRAGNRLSVTPIEDAHWRFILSFE